MHSSLCFASWVDTESGEIWLLSVSPLTAACRRQLHHKCLQLFFFPLAQWLMSCMLFISLRFTSLFYTREVAGCNSRPGFALQLPQFVQRCGRDRGQKHMGRTQKCVQDL